jgi:hypothetical protein
VPLTPAQINNIEKKVSTRRWWNSPRSVPYRVFDKKAQAYARKYSKWYQNPTVDNLRYLSNSYSALERIGAYF